VAGAVQTLIFPQPLSHAAPRPFQEQFWAGAYPPARGGRVRRSQYDAPPARPSSPLLLRPVSAPAENGDVTRTPCRPSQLMDGAELVLSPGEGGGSQYIHSPLPAHLDVPAEAQNTRPHAHETECHGFGALSRPPLFPLFQARGAALRCKRRLRLLLLTRPSLLSLTSPAASRSCTWCGTARASTTRRVLRQAAAGTSPASSTRPSLRAGTRKPTRWATSWRSWSGLARCGCAVR